MTSASVFDATPCELGEGPFWAEGRLYWFDILGKRLHASDGSRTRQWQFEEYVSAGGVLEGGGLLIFSETGLWRFDPESGERSRLTAIEADNPATRCNDGRADRQGGFWLGTMGKKAEKGAGALYRYHRGELRKLRDGLSIPNGLCFAPDGRRGYFADSAERRLYNWALDADGWPMSAPDVFFEAPGADGKPDGAVMDRDGALWCAMPGGARVLRLLPDGRIDARIDLPVAQPTCPAFGGDLRTLYITTSREGLDAEALSAQPLAGATFAARVEVAGLPEPRVLAG